MGGAPPEDAGVAPVRPGEELDLARLEPWLRSALGVESGPLAVGQFPGGHSNLTYLVRIGGREVVLRRPPLGARVRTAHDMGREYRVLERLGPAWDKAPRLLARCEDVAVIGAPFYLMERVPGLILRRDPPPGLAVDAAAARRLGEAFVDTLVELHALDPAAIGLGDFGRPDGYVARQVDGWTRRYGDARTDDVPDMEETAAWLAASLPPNNGASIIHNDFKYDNLVLDPDRLAVRGVLDWEMATRGDPLMDLGTALAYWVEAGDPDELQASRFGPTHLPGSLTRRELAARYLDRSGRPAGDLRFYYAFGLFKTAVVAQQIYARYRQGATRDARFAAFGEGVKVLARQATRALRAPGL
jgi:aminoglycoside phosphotransferase (APT) family kinase protein